MKAGKKVVIFAFLANLSIALVKLFVFLISRSSSMFSEAIHSFVDTGNQVFLLIGINKSQKKEDKSHQFGYSKESFFWAYLVAVQLFTLGGVYSIYKGIQKIIHKEPLENIFYVIILIFFSILAENFSFQKAKKVIDAVKGELSYYEYIKKSINPEIIVVFLEDLAAMISLTIAFIFILLYLITKNPIYDGIGSVCIGVILLVAGFIIGGETKSLLIGEAAPEDMQRFVEKVIKSHRGVEKLIYVRSMVLGSDSILVAGKVDFKDNLNADEIGGVIDEIENEMRAKYPEIKKIYLEPDTYMEN
jgi:cation diffusion facilitator family transporter